MNKRKAVWSIFGTAVYIDADHSTNNTAFQKWLVNKSFRQLLILKIVRKRKISSHNTTTFTHLMLFQTLGLTFFCETQNELFWSVWFFCTIKVNEHRYCKGSLWFCQVECVFGLHLLLVLEEHTPKAKMKHYDSLNRTFTFILFYFILFKY